MSGFLRNCCPEWAGTGVRIHRNTHKEIEKVEKEIRNNYDGEKRILSLTTKFLWLKIKQPIIIYDSRARKALGTKDGKLADYYEKWNEDYSNYQNQIKEACSKLYNLHLYAVDQDLGTTEYIKSVSSESWFHERVFDIYLWNKGGNG